MGDIQIVTSWDSMPPEVYAEGQVYSTRVLADQYKKMEEALKEIIDLPGSRQDEASHIASSSLPNRR